MATKKAKRCKMIITEKPSVRIEREYQCPNCKVHYKNWIDDNATRIRCDCGQELIIEKIYVQEKFKITNEESLKIVESIANGGFKIHGIGHFDITKNEAAELIKIAFNEERATEKISEYYDKISPLG